MLELRALHIENFGPFKGLQTIEFPSETGVVVVYGENMRGKTSLLNAIRFAFFGKVIGRGREAAALHGIGNWEQAASGIYGFMVELEFNANGHSFKLTRKCAAKSDKPAIDDDYRVEHYLERDGTVLGPDQTQAELERILPEQISRFFLFDGELLQEYEDLLSSGSDMGRRISDSIERILGVPILTSARATALRLKEQSEKREATAAQSDQKTSEYGNQLAELHAQRDVLKEDKTKLGADLEGLRVLKATLEESLKRKERYASLMGKRDSLDHQLRGLIERQSVKRPELETAMSSAWCTVLQAKMHETRTTLIARQTELETRLTRRRILASLKEQDSGKCPACLQEITPAARAELEQAAIADETDETTERSETELAEVRAQMIALEHFIGMDRGESLKMRWEALEEIAIDVASKEGELVEIQKQLENVDEASLRKDKTEHEQTVREIDAAERGLKLCQEKLAENAVNADALQKRLNKISGGDLGGERNRRMLYSSVHLLFDEAVAAYREQLRHRVESDATRYFKALTTEADYKGLRINDSYGLTIIHADGEAIPVRSAGAEHIVALCLVGALQHNAPLQGPIIIDSPFGRLDVGHTTNIVRALPGMAQQVMLLVYEDELPAGLARTELKGKLLAEWLLERRSARHTELVRRRD